MSRSPVQVREAHPADAEDLVHVWGAALAERAGERATERDLAPGGAQEAATSVARIAADPDQRLLVAVVEGGVVGAVLLTRGALSPIHAESAVFVLHLQVLEPFRRHGVGHALIEATVSWAEEKDTTHVVAAAAVASRDTNRFMARLGLGQVAVLRGATVASLRAKLPVETPAAARVGSRHHRSVGQVLVRRRSMKRAQARPS